MLNLHWSLKEKPASLRPDETDLQSKAATLAFHFSQYMALFWAAFDYQCLASSLSLWCCCLAPPPRFFSKSDDSSPCSVSSMSLCTNANPTSSPDMKADTKSPRIEMTELSSSSVPNSIFDNGFRLGDPFLDDFYDSGMPDQRNLMNKPGAAFSRRSSSWTYIKVASPGHHKKGQC